VRLPARPLALLTPAFERARGRLVLRADRARLARDCDPRRGGWLAPGRIVPALNPRLGGRLRARIGR
jgi:hypothetical protein